LDLFQTTCKKKKASSSPNHADTLVEALQIAFNNSIVKFGKCFWKQILGTGKGIHPTPHWKAVFFRLFERVSSPPFHKTSYSTNNLSMFPSLSGSLYHPIMSEALFQLFRELMHCYFGLEWTITTCSKSSNFMDLTETITTKKGIKTTLFERPHNIYLYIPPYSAHPKGTLTCLILQMSYEFSASAPANLMPSIFQDCWHEGIQ
jgi:hypothetical protein